VPPRTASFADGSAAWAIVSGRVVAPGHILVGTVTGGIVFRDSSGAAVTCPQAALIFGATP
jgi:hypothetical protein